MKYRIFDKWYKILTAYALIIMSVLLTVMIPSAAMVDFNLTISISYIILYLFHLNNNRVEYVIAIIILLLSLMFSNASLIDTFIDLLGYALFTKFYKPHQLFKAIYYITIIITLLMFIMMPVLINKYQNISINYLDIFLNSVYIRYLLTVFPAYVITQWAINGIIINIIIKKRELKVN